MRFNLTFGLSLLAAPALVAAWPPAWYSTSHVHYPTDEESADTATCPAKWVDYCYEAHSRGKCNFDPSKMSALELLYANYEDIYCWCNDSKQDHLDTFKCIDFYGKYCRGNFWPFREQYETWRNLYCNDYWFPWPPYIGQKMGWY